jgi:hypothetical protein
MTDAEVSHLDGVLDLSSERSFHLEMHVRISACVGDKVGGQLGVASSAYRIGQFQ